MVAINPFLIGYEKKEDKITALLMHVLERCNCTSQFLAHVYSNTAYNFPHSMFTTHEVQLHTSFQRPVRRAFILGISNDGGTPSKRVSDKTDGHPDGYIYDETNKVLVLIESKIGGGVLTEDQLLRHRNQLPIDVHCTTAVISWREVAQYFIARRCQEDLLSEYITSNFVGVLYQDVLGSEYNQDYFIYLANRHRLLVTNVLHYIEEHFSGYCVVPISGHTEIRFKSINEDARFVTFVLRTGTEPRLILHPGGKQGLHLRNEIHKRYGIRYYQGDAASGFSSYPSELSIPFSAIDKSTLQLRCQTDCLNDSPPLYDLQFLIHYTVNINPKLRRNVLVKDSVQGPF